MYFVYSQCSKSGCVPAMVYNKLLPEIIMTAKFKLYHSNYNNQAFYEKMHNLLAWSPIRRTVPVVNLNLGL
ncbi:hypothetical protein Mgra_00008746 [Meloidogyne graminicola]|uniref:Uncharacterized protein n=1 Tax=Meloidogyne graminicola TaxID=189291 RepID=A0A8S9ZEU7_9BILA|nr:hypothetical protein Mgra_00008746 [Meloidogyne graminicola]